MYKYFRSSSKIFGILALLCFFMIATGIILIIVNINQFEFISFLLALGIPLGIIFFTVFIAEHKSYLIIDQEKIIFPFALTEFHQNDMLTRKWGKSTVFFKDIKFVKVKFNKGDKIISKDTSFYHFYLNNGIEFSKTFFPYGKIQEKEIVSYLKGKVRFVN